MAFRSSNGRIDVEVTVKKTELMERLTKNRQKHNDEFQQAITLWRKDLQEIIKNIDVNNITKYPKDLEDLEHHCPDSYVKDYDDVIEMFGMSTNEDILLNSQAFRNFCRDEWEWKSDISDNKYYRKILKM